MFKTAHRKNRSLFGFTLVEIMVAIAILSFAAFPIYLNWSTSRSGQALAASAGELADQLETSHIFAREAKDSASWGVRASGVNQYQVISGSIANPTVVMTRTLASQINFTDPTFIVWFEKGTGETEFDRSIELINNRNKKIKLNISKTGLVETSVVY